MTLVEGTAGPQTDADSRREKREMFDLITQLHARHIRTEWIAAAIGVSPRRVRQIVVLLRLEPPEFETLGEAFTWLASELPDVEMRLRHFRNGNQSSAEEVKAA